MNGFRKTLAALVAAFGLLAPAGEALAQERGVTILQPSTQRGWMGIDVSFEQSVTQDRTGRLSDHSRVRITGVIRGGPGDEAGLRTGDIIVRVDGVAASYSTFQERASSLRPGEMLALEVERNGEPRTIRLVTGERPALIVRSPLGEPTVVRIDSIRMRVTGSLDSIRTQVERLEMGEWRHPPAEERLFDAGNRLQSQEARARALEERRRAVMERGQAPLTVVWQGQRVVAGAELAPLNPRLATYFGTDRGVLVVEVFEGAPAALAGLLEGDVVQRVNGAEVDSIEGFRRLMEEGYRTPPVTVTVLRERRTTELSFSR